MDNTIKTVSFLANFLLLASTVCAMPLGGQEKVAITDMVTAYDAIDTFGVAAHATITASESAANIAAMIKYLGGIKYIRQSVDMSVGTNKDAAIIAIHQETGARFVGLLPHNYDANYATSKAFVLNNISMFAAVEGANEVNLNPTTYNGLSSPQAERAAQALSYNDFHSLLPVYSPTLAYYVNRAQYIADVATYRIFDADFCNYHSYPVSLNNSSAGGMIYTLSLNESLCANKPPVVTEIGAFTVDGSGGRGMSMGAVTESVQAKYVLNSLMSAVKQGAEKVFLYELVDGATDTPFTWKEYHFGLFHYNLTPKVAATAIQNTMSILQDATQAKKRDISISISGEGAASQHLLIQKSDGSHVLTLWQEADMWDYVNGVEVAVPDVSVSLVIPSAKVIKVYDPLVGKTPVQQSIGSAITVTTHGWPVFVHLSDL